MKMNRLFQGACLAVVAAGVAVADDSYLKEKALRDAISGHSLRGQDWIEYYAPDGTIFGKARLFGVRSYTGSWRALSDRVCYDYDGTAYDTCSRLKMQGERVYHYTLNGSLKNDGVATRFSGNRISEF